MAFQAGTVVAELKAIATGFSKGIRQAEKSTEDLRAGLDRVSGTFGRVAAVSGAAFAAISAALGFAARTGAKFEESMVNVGAVTGAAGNALNELSSIAVEMGETTIFSASQVAEAMFALGSSGISAAKDFRNILTPALDLAAASQADIGLATDAVLSALAGFGLGLDQATRVADVFSAANETSRLNLVNLSQAMPLVAATADGLGISIEDTTSVLAGLAEAGIKGQRAGTALKVSLGLLAKATGPAAKILEKLGFSQKRINKLLPTPIKLFKELGKAGITAAQSLRIFGLEGGPAVLAITKQLPKIEAVREELGVRVGSAARIAAVQLAATSAKFKLLGSAMESVSIAIFQSLQPAINAAIKAATNVAKIIADWIKENKDLASGLAIAAVAVTGTVAAISSFIAIAAAAGAAIIGLRISMAGFGAATKLAGSRIRTLASADIPLLSKALKSGNTKLLAITKSSVLGKAGMLGMAAGVGALLGSWINSLPFMDKFFGKLGDIVSKIREGNAVTGTAAEVNETVTKRMAALRDQVKKFASDQKSASDAVKEFGDISLGTLKTDEDAIRILGILNKRIKTRIQLAKEAAAAPAPPGEAPGAKPAPTPEDVAETMANLLSLEELKKALQIADLTRFETLRLSAQQLLEEKKIGEEEFAIFIEQIEARKQVALARTTFIGSTALDALRSVVGSVTNDFTNFFQSLISGSATAAEAFKALGKAILASIVRAFAVILGKIVAIAAIMLVVKAIFGQAGVNIVAAALGVPSKGFSKGGKVAGAQFGLLPTGEDMLVGVRKDEGILTGAGVRAVGGAAGLAALNEGRPMAASGGTGDINITIEGALGPTQDQIERITEIVSEARLGFAGGI